MKAMLRMIEVNGQIMESLIVKGQDASLLKNVRILFSVNAEGQPHELYEKLNLLATKKANELGIKLPSQ